MKKMAAGILLGVFSTQAFALDQNQRAMVVHDYLLEKIESTRDSVNETPLSPTCRKMALGYLDMSETNARRIKDTIESYEIQRRGFGDYLIEVSQQGAEINLYHAQETLRNC